MKNWVKSYFSIKQLMILFILLGLGFFLTEIFRESVPLSYSQVQIDAAQTMLRSFQSFREAREDRGIFIDEKSDPNKTGMIGEEYTQLTTTLGNLSAKRTSTNPDFAALMVRYFKQANLGSGDVVAVGSSGSFPALMIATLSACKVMELIPLIIYSIGASEYGATISDFTFIDMLEVLNKNNIFSYQLLAVSMGGNNDQGEAMFYPDSQSMIRDIAQHSGVFFIDTDDLSDNIQKRMQLYREASKGKQVRLFVNIGGASANFGNTPASITYPNGLVTNPPEIPNHPERGLIFEYQALGVPVIHLLNIRDLALKNGILIDPIPLPKIGQSSVYFESQYPKWIIILTILVATTYLVLIRSNKAKED